MMTVMLAALLAVKDDAAKLAEAAKKSADWKSYKFSVNEAAKKGGSAEGVWEKDKGYVTAKSITAGGKTVTLGKDGTWAESKKKSATKAPHEQLVDIDKLFSKVTGSSEGDSTVYSGDLTTDGAAALLGLKGGKTQAKGSAKVTVGKDGQISKLEISAVVTRTKGDQTISRTTTFSEINTAKAVIPEDAKKALGL